jgi:hypothetical protein
MGLQTVAVGFWLLILSVGYGWAQVMVFPHLADGNIGDGTRWATEIDLVNSS